MEYISGSMIAMVAGGLLTATFGLLASLSNQERTPRWICGGAFIAGLLVIGAGVYAGIGDAKDNRRIVALAQENVALATGGDSYGYLCVGSNAVNNIVKAKFIHHGKYPLYDCKVKIMDVTKFQNLPHRLVPNDRTDWECTTNHSIGNTAPAQLLDGPILELPVQRPVQEFRCEFIARNGRWEQDIIIHYLPEATVHWSDGTNSILLPERSVWNPGWKVTRGADVLHKHNAAMFQKNSDQQH